MVFEWEQERRWEERESKIMLAQLEAGNNGEFAPPKQPGAADATGPYCSPSFSKKRQMVSMPRWKFGMWNFSLGA